MDGKLDERGRRAKDNGCQLQTNIPCTERPLSPHTSLWESTYLVNLFNRGPGKLWNGSESLEDTFHAFTISVAVA